ncbi:AraC family transcriptional regulator of adaptative response / DNA-3-methyladenine glycosylase II [Amycolatopsis lexingtonensis]|uniref:AraC family transcriptional regulator of adaptative response / DNA-3-methyladenine glycosylase II n=1 Tax=Amycolatopsis lexingtonensis TaxID=218822 RepID=A0ABR9ICZ0_9PSEU|nr:AlkA N-terminal domain-containing protein [Amycolatopsis lexingtonensis]MBE1501050.1 AraC family transcriptional regulator of adaptative response / DNA-3-methyladenine glycosylase II [Amycolatopsis lexingtonensis]
MVTTTEPPALWRDVERCYRVVTARDSRFDGQFIMAVRTTGIYCRPSCPASTPKAQNVRFFPTSAAAQANGFRACRRCLPDAVPGSPDWNVRADLAARAMRLISDGTVEREGVPGLARRLGYSERQLGRVLTAELGAGPLALARAHRAHSARLLIELSELPLTDVAFAAGFSSVRQFNETIREVFATTPSQLRAFAASRRGCHGDVSGTRLSLRLPFRPPFDADGLLRFFAGHAVPGVEVVTSESYARSLRLAHGTGVVRLTPQADHVRCELVLTDLRDLGSAVSRVRRLLDLDAAPAAVTRVLGADPALAPLVATAPGIRVPGAVDGEELLLRTLLGDQVPASLGEEVPGEWGVTRLFPATARIAATGHPAATALAEGRLDVHVGRDAADLRAELLACPGIDAATADYVLMRVLGAPDVLLAEDPEVRYGAEALGIAPESLPEHARKWTPWCSYAGRYLQRAAATGLAVS